MIAYHYTLPIARNTQDRMVRINLGIGRKKAAGDIVSILPHDSMNALGITHQVRSENLFDHLLKKVIAILAANFD